MRNFRPPEHSATHVTKQLDPYSLTVAETCRRYGISRTTIYSLALKKHIIACKLGRRTLIIAESVERYLASLPDIHATGGTGS